MLLFFLRYIYTPLYRRRYVTMSEITIITTEERLPKIRRLVEKYVIDIDNNSVLIRVPKLRWPVIRRQLQNI